MNGLQVTALQSTRRAATLWRIFTLKSNKSINQYISLAVISEFHCFLTYHSLFLERVIDAVSKILRRKQNSFPSNFSCCCFPFIFATKKQIATYIKEYYCDLNDEQTSKEPLMKCTKSVAFESNFWCGNS